MDSDTAREALPALLRSNVGTTNPDGSVTVRRHEARHRFLYGPYWRLNRGTYRLEFACDIAEVDHAHDDFVGIEVVAQNRFLLAVAEFRQADLRHGKAGVTFRIADEFAQDLASDAMIEFRFLHYGAATFSVTSVTLCPQQSDDGDGDGDGGSPGFPKWRLAPRLHSDGLELSTPSGVQLRPGVGRASLSCRLQPSIPLPCGQYRLSFDVTAGRWHRVMGLKVGVGVSVGNTRLATQSFGSADLGRSGLALGFSVPPDQAMEHAADDELTIEFWKSGIGDFAVGNIELAQIGRASDAIAPPDNRSHPRPDIPLGTPAGDALPLAGIVGKAPIRIVIVGNCQAEVLAAGIRSSPESDRIRAKYHAARLPANLVGVARADIEACDILLAQDIGDFEDYPLKDALPAGRQVHRFPLLMFATPWPFDSMSGLPDHLAYQREQSEPLFPNLDGGLARLRKEIPDHEARFLAYRALAFDWPADLGRLANFEERRLLAMDGKFGTDIGARILENFRLRQEFHSVGHPGGRLFGLLLDHICSAAALGKIRPHPGTMDALRNAQIPVHPLVARKLGLEWADEHTLYEFRGVPTTWETYVRRYIHHFG